MPATENVWRNLKTMHIIFAASTLVLLFVVLIMMYRDFSGEWRSYQREGRKLAAAQLRSKYQQSLQKLKSGPELKAAEARLAAANDKLRQQAPDFSKLTQERKRQEGALTGLIQEVKFKRAERDAARSSLGLLVRDLADRAALDAGQKKFDKAQQQVDTLELKLQVDQAAFDAINRQVADMTKERDAAEAEIKRLGMESERLGKAVAQLEPDTGLSKFKLWLMEQPIIEGFNGPFKINQIWLPDLRINYGGMVDVPRFDRCISCHVNIDKFEAGNVPAYPYDAHGQPEKGHHEGAVAATGHEKKSEGYRHPFASHPRPDLYLSDSSPHRMQVFGCTSCHDGQGSGTSFQNASHAPNSAGQAHHWSEEYQYFHNHFWEAPMAPQRLMEAGCVKCHHNIVELGVNSKYGASAPKLYQGFELVRKYGCFGCHEINGFNVGRQIGPDMRVEPQSQEEADRIASDPKAVAGTYRKVGPGLRHFSAKTTRSWTRDWISAPRNFRPDTRMPQFFHLTGKLSRDGHDPVAEKFEPIEIEAMTRYLFNRSATMEFDHWAADYQPNLERGKDLFSKRGCLACHEHGDFPTNKADFGPNLSNVYAKISRDKGSPYSSWLYTWLRNPSRHSARTKMPDTYLDPYTESGATAGAAVRIDPAADIMAYLLSRPEGDGKRALSPAPVEAAAVPLNSAAVDELFFNYLTKSGLTHAAAKQVLETRQYLVPVASVKGDEIELAGKTITDEVKMQYLGRRSISRYGCYGCHDIPEFEKARPIGTALQDWGRKDPSKLALEHIEEYLEFYGETDPVTGKRSSTKERVEASHALELAGTPPAPARGKDDVAATFFYEQLMSHGRSGFLWQKVREPRSYDYATLTSKTYDDRLKMPQFPFDEQQIEAIATFVLGLVANPPAEKFVYRPQGPALARIEGEKLLKSFNCTACHIIDLPEIFYEAKPEELAATELAPADHPQGEELLKRLKPPRDLTKLHQKMNGKDVISFHGLLFKAPDPQDAPEDREYSYDSWETLKVGEEVTQDASGKSVVKDKLVHPGSRLLIPAKKQVAMRPARGGAFAEWLVDHLMSQSSEPNRFLAWQASPPPLYLEGIKVQTPWLYRFLKNPDQLRYTTVLRMPRFNLSDAEAQALANYFAAYDGAEYPYQNIPEREPEYLDALGKQHGRYLPETWKLLNAPLCIKCHAVGGREYKAADPKKDIRGPNLDRVQDRLRPEWTLLWLYKPQWITPYTSMPAPFPKNQTQFPELFGGNPHAQTLAARDALMNYARLLELEGKGGSTTLTSAAPVGEPAPGQGNPPAAPVTPAPPTPTGNQGTDSKPKAGDK